MNIVPKEISWFPERMQNSRMKPVALASVSVPGNLLQTLQDADARQSALTAKPVNAYIMTMRDALQTRLPLTGQVPVTVMIQDAAALRKNKENWGQEFTRIPVPVFYTLIIPRFSRIEKIRIASRQIGCLLYTSDAADD